MIISDLNNLEVVEASEVVGGSYYNGFYQSDYVSAYIYSKPYVKDNTALSFGTAYAYGDNTFTKTDNNTYATPYSSSSNGASISVSA